MTPPATVGSALAAASRLPNSESPVLDVQVLLAHTTGQERGWLLAHAEAPLAPAHAVAFEAGLQRLERGEPLPYVLGEWEFYGLKLAVSPAVLIPRPETEMLVDVALAWLKAHPAARRAADIGTGSGCIPIAIAANAPGVHCVNADAGDISPEALAIARANVQFHSLEDQVRLVESDLMSALAGPYDLITANLPYIPEARLPELPITKWEPLIALGGGADGLRLIEPFLEQAAANLASPGLLLAEIDIALEHSAADAARRYFPNARIDVRPDLTGRPRLLVIEQ
jgi:release factor glutamine methyltransferase